MNSLDEMLNAAYLRIRNEIRINAFKEIVDLIHYLQRLGYTEKGIVDRLLQLEQIGCIKSREDKRRTK